MAFARLGDGERAWELARMINPIRHSLDAAASERYKVEPYVLAADVYGVPPHVGRGGWTWYTGSAGWMYRLLVESLLGLQREGDSLQLRPCLPADWERCELHYRHGSSSYHIELLQPLAAHADAGADADGGSGLFVDGVRQQDARIALVDDGQAHRVQWRQPRAPA